MKSQLSLDATLVCDPDLSDSNLVKTHRFVNRDQFDVAAKHCNAASTPMLTRSEEPTEFWSSWNLSRLRRELCEQSIQAEIGSVFDCTKINDEGIVQTYVRKKMSFAEFVDEGISRNGASPYYLTEWPVFDEEPRLMKRLGRIYGVLLDRPVSFPAKFYVGFSGSFTPWHFDNSPNVSIQLSGKKLWRFVCAAPQEFFSPFPKKSAFGHFSRRNTRDDLQALFGRAKQEHLNAIEIVCQPGDILYVPKGVWHSVEVIEPSVSTHFHWRNPLQVCLDAASAASKNWEELKRLGSLRFRWQRQLLEKH